MDRGEVDGPNDIDRYLPVNSMPPEPRPKIMEDMGGGLLMEMPN